MSGQSALVDKGTPNIRHATAKDLEAINQIYNQEILTGLATWDIEPWTIEQRRAWFSSHNDLTPILVAERDGDFAGFAYVTLMSQKQGWRFTREDTIYIDKRFRGQRIGDGLLDALLQACRELGVRLVVASITSTNAASLRLHAKYGFEPVGEMKNAGYKFGEWHSTTYMQLDLGIPAPGKRTW
jgi:phosphinothricin acetyltransferase